MQNQANTAYYLYSPAKGSDLRECLNPVGFKDSHWPQLVLSLRLSEKFYHGL